MKPLLRRIAVLVAVLALLGAGGVALAPWWINAGALRARIEAAASAALGGALRYETIDLAWFPRTEAVLRSATVSVPGTVHGKVRTVRVAFAFLPLLRGRFVPSRIAVDGLDAFVSRPDGRGFWVEGVKAEGSFRSFEGRTEIDLSRLSVHSPALAASGSFRWYAALRLAELSARGSLDGDAVRSQLLALAGEDRTIAQILAIFRGGRLTSFSLESAAPSPSGLFALERMTIRAKVEGARLRIEGPGLDLADVSADVALEGGVLSAERAAARVGRSWAKDGRVLVGLARGDGRLRVEAEVRADLSDLPAILARAVPGRSFREELALVESLEGSAAGRITIGDCAGDLETAVSVSNLRLSARYRRLPWPLTVNGGEFTLDEKSVAVNQLSGNFGRSTFEGVAARVRLGKGPVLESASGSLGVLLEDFLEGVRTHPEAEALARSVRGLSGSIHVDLRRLAGPLARIGEASVAASGTFKEILFSSSSSFSSSSLPPLSVASGRFTVSDDAVRVEDVEARMLDASLRVSGAWNGYRKGAGTVEAVADGKLGAEAIRSAWSRADLPSAYRPAAPVALAGVRLGLAAGGALSLAGAFAVGSGPRVGLDLSAHRGTVDVRSLTIEDGGTRTSIALRRQPDGPLDLRFEGRLAAATVEKLFEEKRPRRGAIEGDLSARVRPGNPGLSTAEGALTVADLEVPTRSGTVTVERLEARAAGSRVDVASSSFVLAGERFSAAGVATLREKGVALDLASFSVGEFVFRPVVADVRFGEGPATVAVRKAGICGVSTTGEARFLPGGVVSLEARADATGPDINVPLTCFGFENVRMTGSYEASLALEGEATGSELLRAVHGPLTFKVAKGHIGKVTFLTRILGVLNATDVFAGKSGTRVGEAMPYHAIEITGDLAEGRVSIGEATFVAPSLTMAATGTVGLTDRSLDLVVLSHPLSTLDKIVQATPVVRTVLGRDFLAVAVKVTGTVGDPKATVTPARDVGKGLIGILERTVTLPVRVFDPPPAERK